MLAHLEVEELPGIGEIDLVHVIVDRAALTAGQLQGSRTDSW